MVLFGHPANACSMVNTSPKRSRYASIFSSYLDGTHSTRSLPGPANRREKKARLPRTLLEQGRLPLVGWENIPKPLAPPEPSSPPQLNGDN